MLNETMMMNIHFPLYNRRLNMLDKIKKLTGDYLTIKLQQGVSRIITANTFYIMKDIKEKKILKKHADHL